MKDLVNLNKKTTFADSKNRHDRIDKERNPERER